ncbi:hypothetical protein V6N11_033303 [Hibiscus sabdariffa]|uniref:Uncharacterized protein n=1 Tax=Hibiscus sabdariffa TaxID=183260 RepID=A0ABR2PXM6_9ROSI
MNNMAEREIQILRGYELRLLRCTLRRILLLLTLNIQMILLLPFLLSMFLSPTSSLPSSPVTTSEPFPLTPHDRVESFINEPSIDDAEKACRVVLVVCIAVAALFWFTQCNLTGPVDGLPKRPLPMKAWWEGSEMAEWEHWARNQLMAAGSDLLSKFSYLQAYHFGSLEKVTSYWGDQLQDGEASTVVSMVHLEAGVLEYIYGRLDHCRLDFELAELAAGLQLSVTGILGLRTVHQVEPKSQMILVANTSSKSGSGDINTSIAPDIQLTGQNVSEASDIFMTPKLVENGNDFRKIGCGGVASTLTAVQQAVVLAQCLLIEKGSPHGEMQGWDMAPSIEAIDSKKFSHFTLKCFCNVLRIRWESTRSRTKARALQMMDNLANFYSDSTDLAISRRPGAGQSHSSRAAVRSRVADACGDHLATLRWPCSPIQI